MSGIIPHMIRAAILAGLFTLAAGAALAGEADVVDATAERQGDGTWRFSATLKHADTGSEHYADKWDVLAPDGTVLGTRTLYHPHVNEQPFTRSLRGVEVPAGVTHVRIRAHDSEHGYGGREVVVQLAR